MFPVEAAFRLSETSVALNNILNGDGAFDPTVFARGYNLVKQERDEDDHFEKNDERYRLYHLYHLDINKFGYYISINHIYNPQE